MHLEREYLSRTDEHDFKFIDLFAGIGGIRIALEKHGGECVFSSEWDKYCRKTYYENFKEWPEGDITKIKASSICDHDLLAAGFPCQPFSIAGISKKRSLNLPVGFDDPIQGNLFFEIKRIAKKKRPKAILLENVKNLKSHDKGNTFQVIKKSLESIGYNISEKVIDAKNIVPQHRERIYIVGLHKEFFGEETFQFPKISNKEPKLSKILEKNPDKKYTLTKGVWNALKRHAANHKEKGNGFGYGIADPDGVSRTLSARYYKDGAEILISQGRGKRPRRLTPLECSRLMGFPKSFKVPMVHFNSVSDCQAYKQFGNSVTVPVVELVANKVANTLRKKILTYHAN